MNWFPCKSVLVPVDFSAESIAAVDTALECVESARDLHIIHVMPYLAALLPYSDSIEENEARLHKAYEELKQHFSDEKYQGIQLETVFGDPGDSIASFAEKIEAQLIVMPSHGRTGLTHLLIGSVAERVVRLAKCPVLVLKKDRGNGRAE